VDNSTALLEPPENESMAKKRNDIAVKIDADVYRGMKTVAAWKGFSVAKYLSETMRPIVERELRRMSKDFGKHKENNGEPE